MEIPQLLDYESILWYFHGEIMETVMNLYIVLFSCVLQYGIVTEVPS